MSAGLVLEGGGLRGVFTGGILEYFIEKDLYFPYVIGVSAGACNGTSYLARQKGRNKQVTIGYIRDPRYCSYWNFIRGKGLLGMDFLFDELPNRLCPLDYQTLMANREHFVIVTTDCQTGKAVYISKDECRSNEEYGLVVLASSSLPFISEPVHVKGKMLLDGGIADSIPIRRAITDGNRKNVVLVTREKGYRKPMSENNDIVSKWLLTKMYGKYPELIQAIKTRNQMYNDTIEYLEELEQKGDVLVLRPQTAVKVKRIDRDTAKLEDLYNQGYQLAREMYPKIIEFIN